MDDTRTCNPTPAPWAIFIGIDEYSLFHSDENLSGCANDVAVYHHYLKDHLSLEDAKTFAFIARSSDTLPRTTSPDPRSDTPTKRRVLKAMDYVLEHANASDFVLFHFSGHGDRRPTLHLDHKPKGSHDELLCLLDGEISDVEFGTWLDKMAEKGVAMLATLDCCFSGGATRGEVKPESPTGLVRCRPHNRSQSYHTPLPDTDASAGIEAAKSRSMRNAMMKESWLFRHREYTAIAACQPQEPCQEVKNDEDVWHGACTTNLITALQTLGARRVGATYSELQGLLEVKLKNDGRTLQRPLLLGEGNRLVFQSEILPDDDTRPSAYVLSILEGYVEIDTGASASVRIGDRYRLSHPCWSRGNAVTKKDTKDGGVVIKITKVDSMSSRGKLERDGSETDASVQSEVQIGWFADLILRANPMVVPFLSGSTGISVDGESEILQNVQHSWRSFNDSTVPVTLIFKEAFGVTEGSAEGTQYTRQRRDIFSKEGLKNLFHLPGRSRLKPQRPPYKFSVKLEAGSFIFLDSHQKPLQHFPRLPANSEDVTEHLMKLLRHLRRFDLVDTLPNPCIDQQPRYKLTVKKVPVHGNTESVVSSWRVVMENLEPDRTLYLTILNLTPLYGIVQLVPSQERRGYPVEPNTPFDRVLDIQIPPTLREAFKVPGMTMRDVFKFCVATEPIDFRFYVQPDLEDALHARPKRRNGSVRAIESKTWWVDSREIIVSSPARGR